MFTKKHTTGHVSRWPYLIPAAFFAVAIYLCFHPPSGPAQSTPQGETASVSKTTLIGNPIRDTQLGWRVLGRNPLREQVDESLPEPDPETWRKITLRMTKSDGHRLDIELLRPLFWLELHEAEPGATIFLDLSEMGAEGVAEVTSIDLCPEIEPDDGRGRPIVTGKFVHEARDGEVIELRLADQEESTRVTANHPYWSVDRDEFIPAGELQPGEQVDTHTGTTRVVSLTPINYTGLLYNLETTEHVYRVGSLGTLVHNSCGKPILLGRGMPARVIPVARAKTWKTYLPNWKKRGEELVKGTKRYDNAVKANAQWVRDQIKAGRPIYDLGGDSGALRLGFGLSDFYEAEKAVLRGLGYRRKLVGSVKLDGKTFALFQWMK